MNLGKQSQTEILNALKGGVAKLALENEYSSVVTDIHLQPSYQSGELLILDDDDQELGRTVVEEWVDSVPEEFYVQVERQLTPLLKKIQKEGVLDPLPLLKPYSFVLIDDEHETVADLLLVDDDTMVLNDGLLVGLDEELDAFLKQLLDA